MADLALTIDNTQGQFVNLNPQAADGSPSILEGPVVITKDSGDGDFRAPDATNPSQMSVLSGPTASVSVFSVSGHSAGAPDATDTITVTVTSAIPPVPPLTSLGLTAGAPFAK